MGRLSVSVSDEAEKWAKDEADRRGIYLSALIQGMILEYQTKVRDEATIDSILEKAFARIPEQNKRQGR